jgi:hypothetical protein
MNVYNKIPSYELPDSIRYMVDLAGPLHLKAMIIRGIKPMSPVDRVIALYALIDDPDQRIRQTASSTLFSLRDTILKPALSDPFMHPYVLDFLFRRMLPTYSLRRTIIENPSVSDETLIEAASESIPVHLEIIANDHHRVCQNIEILKRLYENPETPKPALEELIAYARSCGVIIESIPELSEKDKELIDLENETPTYEYILEKVKELLPDLSEDMIKELPHDELEQIAINDLPAYIEKTFLSGSKDDDTVEYEVYYNEINNLAVAQKIILAYRGNQEARELLLSEPNKMVLLGLANNPGLTCHEALKLVQNKSIDERIIGIIAHRRPLIKDYKMKLALLNNPKCPISEAKRFVQDLGKYDLSTLSKSRAISGTLSSFARRLYETKYGR